MNKETYEALKRIIEEADKNFKFSPDNYRDMKQVKSWIDEVAKEYTE